MKTLIIVLLITMLAILVMLGSIFKYAKEALRQLVQLINKIDCLEDNSMDRLFDIKHDLEKQANRQEEIKREAIWVLKDEIHGLYYKILFPVYKPRTK